MRIGIVELYCGSSGKKGFYNNQEIGLSRALVKKNYECFIFYPQKDINAIKEEVVEESISIVYVPAKVIGNHSRYDWNILLKYKLDVVQVGSDNQIFAANLVSFCDRHNIITYNYIGTIEGDSDNTIKRMIMDCLFHRNLRMLKKHKCFVKTHNVYEKLKARGIQNLTVAPVGLDTTIIPIITEKKDIIRDELNISRQKTVLLFVGRIDIYKRPLEAIKLLSKLPDEYEMVMIGHGALDNQVDEMIKHKGLAPRIRRIQQLPNSEVHKYYKMADYYLNFNEKEIFGMSILEAMYQDCIVIAVRAPGSEEIIEDKVSGFLVNDVSEFETLLLEHAKLNKNSAHQSICEKFVWDKTAEKFDKWIRKKF